MSGHTSKGGATLGDFADAIISNWFHAMSGAPGVALAIAAVFVDDVALKVTLVVIGFLCFMLAAFFIWRAERLRVISLEARLEQKITVGFDEIDPLCNLLLTSREERLLRLRVEARTDAGISDCRGRLLRVVVPTGEIIVTHIDMSFAPAEAPDAKAKNIRADFPEYLDIMFVPKDGTPILARPLPDALATTKIFEQIGDYQLDIAINSPNAPTEKRTIVFRWTGDWNTASMVSA